MMMAPDGVMQVTNNVDCAKASAVDPLQRLLPLMPGIVAHPTKLFFAGFQYPISATPSDLTPVIHSRPVVVALSVTAERPLSATAGMPWKVWPPSDTQLLVCVESGRALPSSLFMR